VGRDQVEDSETVAAGREALAEVAADEAGAAGDEVMHRLALRGCAENI
jgi:hypothetical protein